MGAGPAVARLSAKQLLEHLLLVVQQGVLDVGDCSTCDATGAARYAGQVCAACGGSGQISAESVLKRLGVEAHFVRQQLEGGPVAPRPAESEEWMDGAGVPPTHWDLVRRRIEDEHMWPAGVWIERDPDAAACCYVLSVVTGQPMLGGQHGPDVQRRLYGTLEKARSVNTRRLVISAWSKEGSRLVGYRAQSWRPE